jgi:23S rRNA pseudouridine1911/1915/1917 synthase
VVQSGVAKPDSFELPDGTPVAILYEDRGVLAIDKPAGWMLGPDDAEHHERNLHRALVDDIEHAAWWAASRNLKFLRFVHRLDAPTTGVLLFSKSQGAMSAFSRVFAERTVKKAYLAVTDAIPQRPNWVCTDPLGPDPELHGRHRVDRRDGKEAETHFELLQVVGQQALVLARPVTGRTHQIRIHLRQAGCPVVGDILYGRRAAQGLALRAIRLEYPDPFLRRTTVIIAPVVEFCRKFGFDPKSVPAEVLTRPGRKPSKPGEPRSEAASAATSVAAAGSSEDAAVSGRVGGNPKPESSRRPVQPNRTSKHPAQRRRGQGRPDRS